MLHARDVARAAAEGLRCGSDAPGGRLAELAHVPAKDRGRLTRDELGALFGRELGILLAAAAPTAALVLGALGVFHETTAIWIALGVGLVTLAAEGIRFARLERLGPMGTVVAMAINLALGLVVVALKVLVAH